MYKRRSQALELASIQKEVVRLRVEYHGFIFSYPCRSAVFCCSYLQAAQRTLSLES
jgi:hypothetical protein